MIATKRVPFSTARALAGTGGASVYIIDDDGNEQPIDIGDVDKDDTFIVHSGEGPSAQHLLYAPARKKKMSERDEPKWVGHLCSSLTATIEKLSAMNVRSQQEIADMSEKMGKLCQMFMGVTSDLSALTLKNAAANQESATLQTVKYLVDGFSNEFKLMAQGGAIYLAHAHEPRIKVEKEGSDG